MLRPKEVVISTKVFVGNLNYETTQKDLETLFSEVGEVVDVFLPIDRARGRPRGFAFVEFTEGSAVGDAIEKFDGYQLNDRSIRVNEAEERRRPSPGGFRDSGPADFSHGPKGGAGKPKGSRRNIRGKKRGF